MAILPGKMPCKVVGMILAAQNTSKLGDARPFSVVFWAFKILPTTLPGTVPGTMAN